jgi:hypothetical protein
MEAEEGSLQGRRSDHRDTLTLSIRRITATFDRTCFCSPRSVL